MKNNLPLFVRFFFTLLSILLIVYILQDNITPLGASVKLSSEFAEHNIKLIPPSRVTQLPDSTLKQIDDVIYFSTSMPSKYENATLKITFKNNDPFQEFYLGFQ